MSVTVKHPGPELLNEDSDQGGYTSARRRALLRVLPILQTTDMSVSYPLQIASHWERGAAQKNAKNTMTCSWFMHWHWAFSRAHMGLETDLCVMRSCKHLPATINARRAVARSSLAGACKQSNFPAPFKVSVCDKDGLVSTLIHSAYIINHRAQKGQHTDLDRYIPYRYTSTTPGCASGSKDELRGKEELRGTAESGPRSFHGPDYVI